MHDDNVLAVNSLVGGHSGVIIIVDTCNEEGSLDFNPTLYATFEKFTVNGLVECGLW